MPKRNQRASEPRARWTVAAAGALLLATVVVGLLLGFQTRRQFLEIADGWTEFSSEADRKGALISAIRGHMGYGGIIHTFKNYVLRGDDAYRARLLEQLAQFDATTEAYLESPIAPEERAALETIVGTIDAYREKLPIAEMATAADWTAEETDARVRVDDTAAISALRDLESFWLAQRKAQSDRLIASVDRGKDLIVIGFLSMGLLVLAALALVAAFRMLLRNMHDAMTEAREQLAMRHRLERREQRLAQAVEQSPATIMITDTDGRIGYVNRHFEDLSGWSRDEVIGRTPAFLQSGDTDTAEYQRMRTLLEDGKTWRGILHNVRKDGGGYWIESTILPLREADGEAHSYLGIGEDITERRQAREQMARAQKIEAVGLLAGGIAHDFNSVLTSILGSAHLAALDAPEDSDLAREVEQIEIAARRAQLLVQQLLGFARRQAGNPVPTDVRSGVRQALRLLRAATAPATRFVFAEDGAPVWAAADPTHLHQIVMNLCGNAAEALGGRPGTVEVRVEAEAARTGGADAEAPHRVRIEVRDDGPGMTEDIRRRVFDAFFTTKPLGKGTGLGLAVVQGLVSDMGGTIEVESVPGEGSVFTLWLPGCLPSEAVEAGAEGETPYGTERLLVVDDEAEIATTLRRSLTRYGYRVEAFTSARAALLGFETAPDRFDAVITDVVMPDIDGVDLARRLRVVRPALPILFLTGFAPGTTSIDGAAPAIVDKPVDPRTLALRLRRHLDRA